MNSFRLIDPPRFAIVTPRYWPHVGEVELFSSQLAEELIQLGTRPVILTGRWAAHWPESIWVNEVQVVRLPHAPRGGWSTLRYMIELARWLRQNRASLQAVYVLGLRHEAYATIGALRGSGIPVVLRCVEAGPGGDCAWQMTTHFGDRMRRRCQETDAIVAPHALVQEELLRSGYAPDAIHHIPDGVAPGLTRSADRRFRARAALADANHDLAAAEYAPVMVCVGRLVDAPSLAQLLLAWREIARHWPSARLWLIGDGPARDSLYEQIHALDMQGQVMMPGTFEDLNDVWLAADAFVVPQPPFACQQILSAMAAGLPIVSADGPLARELIEHQRQGLLVTQDRSAWIGALSHLCEYPAAAQELGKAARTAVEQRFSSRVMAERHLAMWDKLIAGRERNTNLAEQPGRNQETKDVCPGEPH